MIMKWMHNKYCCCLSRCSSVALIGHVSAFNVCEADCWGTNFDAFWMSDDWSERRMYLLMMIYRNRFCDLIACEAVVVNDSSQWGHDFRKGWNSQNSGN